MLPSMAKRIDTVAFIASVVLALLAATFAAAAKTGSFLVPSSAAFVFAAIALVFAVAFLLATARPRLNGAMPVTFAMFASFCLFTCACENVPAAANAMIVIAVTFMLASAVIGMFKK